MDEFLFEKIIFRGSTCESFKFIEFPHGEWFLAYISNKKKKIRFMEKMADKSAWNNEIPQNLTDFSKFISKNSHISGISLFFDNKGDLILLYNILNSENLHDLFSISSYNYGKSWEQKPQLISHDYSSWKLHSNPIIIQKGINIGNILIPVENDLVKRSLVIISDDNGKNWHISLYIEPDEDFDNVNEEELEILGSYSPVIMEEKNDNLRILCWISNQDSIVSYLSSDFGATWHESDRFSWLNIDKEGSFDATRLKNNDGSFSEKMIILGSQKINIKYQIFAWVLEDNSPELQIFWKNDDFYQSPPKYCQIYQDSKGLIHFLYMVRGDFVYHYWNANK